MAGLELAGKALVVGGLVMAVTGGVLWALARLPGLSDLPGTISVSSDLGSPALCRSWPRFCSASC